MRVISGERKGFKLKSPKGLNTRPTEDRIKEALFNILGGVKEDSMVLDLFAGSGGLGIEFLSRGGGFAYFIDKNINSIYILKENIQHTSYQDKSKIVKTDSFKALDFFNTHNVTFDYIILDPPYDKDLVIKAVKIIDEFNLLRQDGIIIIEHEKDLIMDERYGSLRKVKENRYGKVTLVFYTNDN